MRHNFGNLEFESAIDKLDSVAKPVAELLKHWRGESSVSEILVAEIDPLYSDSFEFCHHYEIPESLGANCLVVESKRGETTTIAAVLVPIDCRADINGVVRKFLNGRSASMADRDFAVRASGMEFGSITVVGLPNDWKILIDQSLINIDYVLIGGGLRKSKILIPGKMLAELPNVTVMDLVKK